MPPTDYLSITTIFQLPHNLFNGKRQRRKKEFWWGLEHVVFNWRTVCNASLVLCIPTPYKSNNRNRCSSSAPCLRKKHSRIRTIRFAIPPRQHGRRFARPSWSPTDATVRRVSPRPFSPDTTRRKRRIPPPASAIYFFHFPYSYFISLGGRAPSSLSRIAASFIQPSDRMGKNFGLSSRNRAGTQKGREREKRK